MYVIFFDKVLYAKINTSIVTRLDFSSTIYCCSSLSAILTEVRNNEGIIQARNVTDTDTHGNTLQSTEYWFGPHQPMRKISGPLAVRLFMIPVI